MAKLGKHDEALYRKKVVAIPGTDNDDLHLVELWWMELPTRAARVARFKAASLGLPKGNAEKEDALWAFMGSDARFGEINQGLVELLQMPEDNFFIKNWLGPTAFLFSGNKSRLGKFSEIVRLIKKYVERYETVQADQVIAIAEAIIESGLSEPETIRQKVAQWAFEEFLYSFKMLELKTKVGELEMPTTIDELEVEKSELANALKSDLWDEAEVVKYAKIFADLHKAIFKLEFETEVKLKFSRAYAYACGKIGMSVSAMDILDNIQCVLEGFENDGTLEEFWEDEREQEEEEGEKEE